MHIHRIQNQRRRIPRSNRLYHSVFRPVAFFFPLYRPRVARVARARCRIVTVAWPARAQLRGLVRFIGKTQFAEGEWFDIELDEKAGRRGCGKMCCRTCEWQTDCELKQLFRRQEGKNNGTVQGVKYFESKDGP